MAKQTIKLANKRGDVQVFSMAHALNLLRMQQSNGNKGWVIDKSEKYKFGNNEIYRHRDSGDSKKTEKQ